MLKIFLSMIFRRASGFIYSVIHRSTKDSKANFIGKYIECFMYSSSICFKTATKSEFGLKIEL